MNRRAGISGPGRPRVLEILEDPEAGVRRLRAVRSRQPLDDRSIEFIWEQLAEVPDPDQALRNLERLSELGRFPSGREILARLLVLFGSSQFLADVLFQNPEFITWLGREGSFDSPRNRDDLAQELARFHFRASTREDATVLRQFKDREYLRIALRDFLQVADISGITAELSVLADVLLEKALLLTEKDLLRRYGRPQFFDADGKLAAAEFAVIGLGKLGGSELNYSSDIDLLFLYSEEGDTSGEAGRTGSIISNREWFTRLAEGIVSRISAVGPAGHVFRIDMELRPGGRDGELVQSLRSALSYYRIWGAGWERQALLKARCSAGGERLGRDFLVGIEAIIHGRTRDPSFTDEVARIHRSMQARLSEAESELDLKHGRGGIRQIELSVQALQLRHSGSEPWLREGNTLRALHRLSDKRLISSRQHEALASAYGFLRRAEHRLQIPRNRQTFRLPGDRRGLRILARAMGYRDDGRRREADWFLARLNRHREDIQAFFRSVLGSGEGEPGPAPETEVNLFLDPIAAAGLTRALEGRGFPQAEKILRPVQSIRKALVPYRTGPATALRDAIPGILRVLAATANPDRGWRNLDQFFASLARQPARLSRFVRQWRDWVPVVDLLARSDLMADLLIHRPEELEGLSLGPAILKPRSRRQIIAAIRDACRPSAGGADAIPPALCRVRRQELLRIGFRDLQGRAGVPAIQRSLSDLADGIVSEALYLAALEVMGRRRARRRGPEGFTVIGLGRLATREMGYLSDLDILFLQDRPAGDTFPFHQEHRRLAERLIQMLSTITQHGFLYEVDMRLRPSGGEGELAPTLGHLLDYFDTRAEVWERQAFLRTRPVAGGRVLARRALERVMPLMFTDIPAPELARRIADARARLEQQAPRGPARIDLKFGTGGILEVLFLVQFLQLRTRDPRFAAGDPLVLLSAFRRAGVLPDETCRWLHSGYRFLRNLEHNVQLITGRRSADISFSGPIVQELGVAMDCRTGEILLDKLAEYRHEIRRAYEAILHGDPPS